MQGGFCKFASGDVLDCAFVVQNAAAFVADAAGVFRNPDRAAVSAVYLGFKF